MRALRLLPVVLLLALVPGPVATGAAAADPPPYKDPTRPVSVRVADLLGRMTLDEKIGQMTLIERRWVTADGLANGRIGAGFSAGSGSPATNTPTGWADMYDGFQRAALTNRLGVPMIYAIDAVHGVGQLPGATVFPHNIGLGATNDPALVQDVGRAVGQEVDALGIDWSFSPVVAVARNDRWGRTYESYSEDTARVSALAGAQITGEQGAGILATAKHFVGDGGTTGGDDRGNTEVTEAQLRAIHLPPFRAAIDRGVGTIMVSYSSWNGALMHGNRYLLTDVLKGELGFTGIVVSDYGGVDYLDGDGTSLSGDDVRTAINAGVDLVMVPDDYDHFHGLLRQQVEQGGVGMSRIDDAVSRILRKKFEQGLFEHPFADRSLLGQVGSAAHRALARRAVGESVVVLKNEWGVLPLPRSASKVAVVGAAADSVGLQSGGWTLGWQGTTGNAMPGTTILEGVRAAVSAGTTVTYSRDGTGIDGSYQSAIVAVGEKPYAEGWGDDTGSMRLTPTDRAVLDRVEAAGVPVTLVLVSGRPLDIDQELGGVRAAVAAWLPGTQGDGITDVLFGARAPTGTLPMTWMVDSAQQPINPGDGKTPLFPLGYGLGFPATQSAYDTIGAVFYDDQRGTQVDRCTDVGCGQAVGHVADGDFVGWFDVSFEAGGPSAVSVRLASAATVTGNLDVRLDTPSGPLLARFGTSSTGGWQQWVTRTSPTSQRPTGVHRVYLRASSSSAADLVNINWLRFTR
ncbi:glycoside hydrolase family 3 N-terminal domain-containing protein [Cellulomonas sp. P5_C6]